MKFYIKDFFSKCDQIHRKLPIWSYLLKKSLMENFIFYAVLIKEKPGKEKFRKNFPVKNFLQVFSGPYFSIFGLNTDQSAFTCWKSKMETLEQGVFIVIWTYFTPCSLVSIVNIEHVIAGLEGMMTISLGDFLWKYGHEYREIRTIKNSVFGHFLRSI